LKKIFGKKKKQCSLFSLFFVENGGFERPKGCHGCDKKQNEANQNEHKTTLKLGSSLL